jgi:hypothetical protein
LDLLLVHQPANRSADLRIGSWSLANASRRLSAGLWLSRVGEVSGQRQLPKRSSALRFVGADENKLIRCFTRAGFGPKKVRMWNAESLRWIVVGAVALVLAVLLLAKFSPNARLRRRLKKTHRRIVAKPRHPSVQLNVKTPKE